jgi:hypothetical protein
MVCFAGSIPRHSASQVTQASARYQTRASDCPSPVVAGSRILFKRSNSGISADGYVASRTLIHSAPARGITGGTITVCAEYGSVEILDSPDDQIHVQVHADAFGEGARDPAAEALAVLRATTLKVRAGRTGNRFALSVVNDTLGFSSPGGQPALTHIRILVPGRGTYLVDATAFHGAVGIRRLTIGGLKFRGRVGDKFKGIPGYVGSVVLDNILLMGDADVSLDGEGLSASVIGRMKVGRSARFTVHTGGDVTLSVQPHPDLAVRAVAASNAAPVRVQLEGTRKDTTSRFQSIEVHEGAGFGERKIQLRLSVTSTAGRVNLASMPAAPLAR